MVIDQIRGWLQTDFHHPEHPVKSIIPYCQGFVVAFPVVFLHPFDGNIGISFTDQQEVEQNPPHPPIAIFERVNRFKQHMACRSQPERVVLWIGHLGIDPLYETAHHIRNIRRIQRSEAGISNLHVLPTKTPDSSLEGAELRLIAHQQCMDLADVGNTELEFLFVVEIVGIIVQRPGRFEIPQYRRHFLITSALVPLQHI